jgi:hypothetical protein
MCSSCRQAQKFANSRTSSQQSLNLECLAGDTPAAPVNDPRVGELEAEVRRLQVYAYVHTPRRHCVMGVDPRGCHMLYPLQDETRTEREACDAVLEQLQLSQAECIKLRHVQAVTKREA